MNEFVTTDDVAHDCKYQVHTHTVICKSIMSESGSVCDIVCLHLDDCCEENEVVSSRNSQYTHMKKIACSDHWEGLLHSPITS